MRLAWWLPLNPARAPRCWMVGSRRVPREDLGDVQHARSIAAAAKPTLDVQHAAEIAEHHRLGAAVHDVLALVVRKARRDLAELDGKRTAKAAAHLAFGHLGKPHAGKLREQRTRLLFHAHFAQTRTRIMVRDRA